MAQQLGFIIKLFLVSTIFSLLIKYVAPSFTIAPTTNNTLIVISLPSLLIGLLLGWRSSKTSKEE